MYYLYIFDKNKKVEINNDYVINEGKFLRKFNNTSYKEATKNLLKSLYWTFTTGNKFMLIYVTDKNNNLVHKTVISKKSYKFPFLGEGEIHVGPCETNQLWRGQGIYPMVLECVKKRYGRKLFMIIENSNIASIKGVNKVGFVKTNVEMIREGIIGRWKRKKN